VNCDPTQLVVPGAQPVSWGSLEVTDGVTLRHARIVPAEGPVRGTVVLVHGRTEFIEKYAEVLEELCAGGGSGFDGSRCSAWWFAPPALSLGS
jgi:hypothetical protein